MSTVRYKFRIPGGLGNQLFAYFGALYTSTKVEAHVLLDLASVDRSHYKEGASLLSFNLAKDQVSINNSIHSKTRQNHYIKRLMQEFNRLVGFGSTQLFSPGLDTKEQLERYLLSKSNFLPRLVSVEGYFSDFSFFDEVPREYQSLTLKNTSTAFINYAKQMESKRTLAIHHRLGDFTGLGSSVGILAPGFYKEALNLACDDNVQKVLVFSNDPEQSKNLLRSWGMVDSRMSWLGPTDLPDPAETLILMSLADSILCSNSTFSFWASKLSSPQGTCVYYPEEFRRDRLATIANIPSYWKPITSQWCE